MSPEMDAGEEKCVVIIPNEQQKEACMFICEFISDIVLYLILNRIPDKPDYLHSHEVGKKEVNVYDLGKSILKECRKEDIPFLKFFVETQMFCSLMEDYFNKEDPAIARLLIDEDPVGEDLNNSKMSILPSVVFENEDEDSKFLE